MKTVKNFRQRNARDIN